MAVIEVFADVCCPFTHVGLRRLVDERAERSVDVQLVVRAWPLELVNGAPLDGDLIATEIEAIRAQVAPDLFGGFERAAFPASSVPAMALTAAAYRQGAEVGEQVALAVRWALFEEGRDLGDPAVLDELARVHGIVGRGPDDDAQVRADWEEGQRRGVVGSPHFLVGAEGFFCPGLDIHHEDGTFTIQPDREGFAAFAARALGSPA